MTTRDLDPRIPPITQNVQRALYELRNEAGASQADVAKVMSMLGFPWVQGIVSEVEAGKRRVTIDEAFGLAMSFGLPVNDFLGLSPEQLIGRP